MSFEGETYQSRNKKVSEKRHVDVHKLLTRMFPDCIVTYDGDTGHDHLIQLGDYKLYLETKTVDPIIKTGMKLIPKDHPFIFEVPRLGRFKFDRRRRSPYVKSQHDDLVDLDGWYIFVIGDSNKNHRRIYAGMKASELRLSDAPTVKRIAWGVILSQCYPNWMQRLKYQVYKSSVDTSEKTAKTPD